MDLNAKAMPYACNTFVCKLLIKIVNTAIALIQKSKSTTSAMQQKSGLSIDFCIDVEIDLRARLLLSKPL